MTGRPKKYEVLTCSRCKETDWAKFYASSVRNAHERGRTASLCRTCHKSFVKKYSVEKRKEITAKDKQLRRERKAWSDAYKFRMGCARCPENDPVCLEFHHRDPMTKLFNITHGVYSAMRIDRLEEEAAKCDVLCANCHRKEHRDNRTSQGVRREQMVMDNKAKRRGPDLRLRTYTPPTMKEGVN
jgi:hypothetical protein